MRNTMKGAESLTRHVLALAGQTRGIGGFIAAFGPMLGRSRRYASRLFASVQSLHPEFRAHSYLWKSDWKVAEVTSGRTGLSIAPTITTRRALVAMRPQIGPKRRGTIRPAGDERWRADATRPSHCFTGA